jgi:hypothetical protein
MRRVCPFCGTMDRLIPFQNSINILQCDECGYLSPIEYTHFEIFSLKVTVIASVLLGTALGLCIFLLLDHALHSINM